MLRIEVKLLTVLTDSGQNGKKGIKAYRSVLVRTVRRAKDLLRHVGVFLTVLTGTVRTARMPPRIKASGVCF